MSIYRLELPNTHFPNRTDFKRVYTALSVMNFTPFSNCEQATSLEERERESINKLILLIIIITIPPSPPPLLLLLLHVLLLLCTLWRTMIAEIPSIFFLFIS